MPATSNTLRSLGLAACLALAATPAAHASIASYDAQTKTFRYSAVSGEANRVVMTIRRPKLIVIEDPNANILTGPRCHLSDPGNWHRAVCKLAVLPKRYRVRLEDGSDHAKVVASELLNKKVLVYGGTGDDLLGTQGARVTYQYGESGKDVMIDGSAAGHLSGGDQADALFGGDGADVLTGGAGQDQFYGQDGNDSLNARDRFGTIDSVIDCGAGSDWVNLDQSESSTGCELFGP